MDKIKIPRAVFEMDQSLARAKEIMRRLEKGEQYIEKAAMKGSVSEVNDGVKLFYKYAVKLNNELEDALFLHENLTTGRTTVVDRKGKAANTMQFNPKEEKVVDLFSLKSMQQLKEVFGEDAIIEFEPE